MVSANILPQYFRSAPGPLKRGSRRRRAVAGAIRNDSQLQDTEKPGFAQTMQQPPTPPQEQELGVPLWKSLSRKRKRRDDIMPSPTVPHDPGGAPSGFSVIRSLGKNIHHTYSRKTTGAHSAVKAGNHSAHALAQFSPSIPVHDLQDGTDACSVQVSGSEGRDARDASEEQQHQRRRVHLRKRKPDTRVDKVPNTGNIVGGEKSSKTERKRKRRAPVGGLALVKSATEVETPPSQLEVSCIRI